MGPSKLSETIFLTQGSYRTGVGGGEGEIWQTARLGLLVRNLKSKDFWAFQIWDFQILNAQLIDKICANTPTERLQRQTFLVPNLPDKEYLACALMKF